MDFEAFGPWQRLFTIELQSEGRQNCLLDGNHNYWAFLQTFALSFRTQAPQDAGGLTINLGSANIHKFSRHARRIDKGLTSLTGCLSVAQ